MSELRVPKRMIDTHRHLRMRSERRYDWILPEHGILNSDFGPAELASDVAGAGITGTILVQAADTYEDTMYMLSVAQRYPSIVAVVGWVPLDRSDEAGAALELYSRTSVMRGVRALTHTYDDQRWILRPDVAQSGQGPFDEAGVLLWWSLHTVRLSFCDHAAASSGIAYLLWFPCP